MKIDIHITDATPVEAQRVLIGMSFAENILGKISPAIKIEKAQKPTPDPTCDEEMKKKRTKAKPMLRDTI